MELAILLSLAATVCTATSSICQRLGARRLEQCGEMRGFDALIVFRLAREPTWLLGFACMLAGFAFQVSALRFGPLALVQPILAVELLFVFGYLALRGGKTRLASRGARPCPELGSDDRGMRDSLRAKGRAAVFGLRSEGARNERPSDEGENGGSQRPAASRDNTARWREWGAAIAMTVGISVFLRAAAPTGGQQHAPATQWWLAGAGAALAVAIAVAAARGGSPSRRAACLGLATGVTWGFIAAVIKELSSHLSGGPAAVFTNWSAYVLMGVGTAALLLTAHAMAAGPLAASQPGFTIGDPVTAILLGVFLFNERLGTSPAALAAEVAGLVVLALGVWTLSGSALITDTTQPQRPGASEATSRELSRRSS
jgi:hypothetical protein